MPLYEYRCRSCGEVVEVLQRLGEAPLGECSHCGGPLEKIVSAPALQFKGSGWYVTDYGRAGKRSQDSSPPPSEPAKPATDPAPAKPAPPTTT